MPGLVQINNTNFTDYDRAYFGEETNNTFILSVSGKQNTAKLLNNFSGVNSVDIKIYSDTSGDDLICTINGVIVHGVELFIDKEKGLYARMGVNGEITWSL